MRDLLKRQGVPIFAGVLLLAAIVQSRGGFIALARLARFLMPMAIVLVIFYGLRAIVRKQLKKMGFAFQVNSQPRGHAAAGPTSRRRDDQGGGGITLEACPKCGVFAAAGHRCN